MVSFVRDLLGFGDEFDFDEGTLGQVLDCEGAAGRVGGGEELGIYLVHRAEIGDLAQEHGGLDHIVQVKAFALQDGTRVKQALTRLLLYASLGECPGLGDDGQLARHKDEIARADGLAVGPDGGRCLISV